MLYLHTYCIYSPRFQRSWGKLVELSTAVSGGPANGLSPFPELTSLLDRFVTTFDPDSPRKQQPSVCLHRMWTSLGQRFIGVVKEVSALVLNTYHMTSDQSDAYTGQESDSTLFTVCLGCNSCSLLLRLPFNRVLSLAQTSRQIMYIPTELPS